MGHATSSLMQGDMEGTSIVLTLTKVHLQQKLGLCL